MRYKPTVLIADDNETFIMYLSVVLNRMDIQAFPVSNGLEALDLAKKIKPDIIMLDIDMPGLNGKQVLKKLKDDSQTRSTPVIMITIKGSHETHSECRKMGCDHFVSKPVDPSKLHEVIQRCIGLSDTMKRKLLRTSYTRKVTLHNNDTSNELTAVSLSERGIYLSNHSPLPVGTKVSVDLPLHNDEWLYLKGEVIYTKGIYGELFSIGPGMAIEFNDLAERDREKLKGFINELFEEGINGTE